MNGEKKYKIGMAAREAGVSPQTVRFYEKQELIKAQQDEQGATRYYGVRQFKQLANIRRYFKLGFSEEEVHDLMDCQTAEKFAELLAKRSEEARAEMEELRLVMEILDFNRYQVAKIPLLLHRPVVEQSPPLCFLVTRHGDKMLESSEIEEIQERWVSRIHLTSLGSIIPRETFTGDPASRLRLSGHCLPEEYLPRMGTGAGDALIRHFPPRRCLHTVTRLDGPDISPAALMPEVYRLLDERGYRVEDDIFGRTLCVLGEGEVQSGGYPKETYYEYWIPIGGD